jgi:hypothetical protein
MCSHLKQKSFNSHTFPKRLNQYIPDENVFSSYKIQVTQEDTGYENIMTTEL